MFIPTENYNKKPDKWNTYSVIVPSVCVGNIGQLAVDLMIATLSMKRVGSLHHDSVIPVIGNDPFFPQDTSSTCNLVTALEVYESEAEKMVALQLRAPLVKGKKSAFVMALMEWLNSCKFKEVIILTGSFAHERKDKQLHGSQLRYLLSTEAQSLYKDEFTTKLNWLQLEERVDLHTGCHDSLRDDGPSTADEEKPQIFLPGNGFAVKLFEECCSSSTKACVLSLFCSEGDNTREAVELITHLNHWKCFYTQPNTTQPAHTTHGGWCIPPSWKLQFGNAYDQILFR